MRNGKSTPPATRDPDRTRARILAAALTEFSTKGFAGARVDAIARRAKGNKRMIYHYFGNKESLFSAVLRHKMTERRAWAVNLPNDQTERLPFCFESTCGDADWVRLLEWEALQDSGKVIDEKERRTASEEWLQRLRQRQKSGELASHFNTAHLALAMQSLIIFPVAFPQLVRVLTGHSVENPRFRKEYGQFLKQFAAAFKPSKTEGK
ncbi:MAG TPA: TetR/AcrR family transcriptional regulator [Verrucomicrobiae bacterium]